MFQVFPRCCAVSPGAILLCLVLLTAVPAIANADEFTVIDPRGQERSFEAELVGSDRDWHALAMPDGEYRMIPVNSVRKRVPKAAPDPMSPEQVARELEKEYGSELFRYDVLGNYVVGLVLSTPLPKASESKARNVLDRATRFMKQVETAFSTFLKEAKIPSNKPKYPLVMLIFETDVEFEQYTRRITQQRGLQAAMIAGFYSGLTNHLAIRLEECSSFDTPFHEAIHQQVYNCGLLQRLSPIPQWFDEGIATGFEAANGKVLAHPIKVSPRYARQALQHDNMTWEDMHVHDEVFRGDVLVTEAYGQAWGLHWLLITKYKNEYNKYLKILSQKAPLAEDTPEERKSDFSSSFKLSMRDMEKSFPQVLQTAMNKQQVSLDKPRTPGLSMTESNLGKVQMTAISSNGVLRLEGKLLNMSPLRPMSFLVLVVTDAGTGAAWFHDAVPTSKTVPLEVQPANMQFERNAFGTGRTFQVIVKSAPSDSPVVDEWRAMRDKTLEDVFGSRRRTSPRTAKP